MFKVVTVISLLLCLTNYIESARILGVFPAPSISHSVVFRILTKELNRRGHELVVITPDPEYRGREAPVNYTEIDVQDVSYKVWNNMLEAVKGASVYNQLLITLQMLVDLLKVQLETPQVKEFMSKDQKFDLVITEATFDLALGYAHRFKAPVITMSSFYGINSNYEAMGAPIHLFLYPTPYSKKFKGLTIKEKIREVVVNLLIKYEKSMRYKKEVDKLLETHFGKDKTTMHELQNKIDMLFVNINPIWEGNRPVPPSVVYLGQLHVPAAKDLPKDLKSYLDSSKGVIYVSFGSNFSPSSLSENKIRLFLNVFSKLPFDVLCKWDAEGLPGKPSNMRIEKWLPQNDLLKHPKVKVFITQGGLQSTDEAIVAGVPLIGIPLRLDQYMNTDKYKLHKIGEQMNLDTLTEEEFYETIIKVAGDDSYRQNVVKLRTLMEDQPMSSLERAVWWAEHVIRHGGARHLRAPAANMGWVEYLELPLVATLLAIFFTTLLILIGSLYLVVKCVRGFFKSKSKKD